MEINKVEIGSDNFDYWFNSLVLDATPEIKKSIPEDIQRKMNKKKGDPSARLSHEEKVYVLSVCFSIKRFEVFCMPDIVDDRVFSDLIKASGKAGGNSKVLAAMNQMKMFVLGGVEFVRSLTYAAHIQNTDIYNLIKEYRVTKGMGDRKNTVKKKAVLEVVNLIKNYESRISQILKRYNLVTIEFMCLIYHYAGEQPAINFHTKAFPAYKPKSYHLRVAVYKVVGLGYIESRGSRKSQIYRITERGIDLVDKVMDEVLIK